MPVIAYTEDSALTPEYTGMEDLRGRIVQMEHRITELQPRIVAMEEWKNQKNVSDAKLELTMTVIVDDLKGIKSGIGKILWAVGGAVLVAIVGFILSGGLVKAAEVTQALMTPPAQTQMASEKGCPAQKPIMVRSFCRAKPYSEVFAYR